jgi:crotonobetaine/carnitine-CoA ligase
MNYLDYQDHNNRVLGTILRKQAEQIGQEIFLVANNERFSYAQAYDMAKRYAVGLTRLGVSKGDNVCLFMSSNPDYVFLSLACNLLGARWVPVNSDYRGNWLEETISDSVPLVVVTDTDHLDHLAAVGSAGYTLVVRDGNDPHTTLRDLSGNDDSSFNAASCDYGDTASIMWTSGTTGRSKGVMQSHNAWVRAAVSSAEIGGVRDGDVFYMCLPLYNSAAWVAAIYPALVSGATVAIDPHFSATDFWDRTRFYHATHVFTLGAMHMFLWNAPERPDDADNPVRSANMVPMPESIHRAFCRRFGIESIHQGFGQSEIMLLLRREDDGKTEFVPNSLGTVPDYGDLEIALLGTDEQPVATGEVGEFCVKEKKPHILFNGYFNNEQANREAFVGGWYHTGDLGRQDSDGNYFFVDRKKDVIRYKGRNVSSVAVESVARQHPAIKDVAVFGVRSDELDSEHEIMLAAVLNDGEDCSEEAIARFINDNAPYFLVPRYIEFLDQLPMTPTQKVRKVELRERGATPATWDGRKTGFKVTR